MEQSNWVKAKEAAVILGVPRSSVNYWLRRMKVPTYYLAGHGFRYDRETLEKLRQPQQVE